MAGKRAKRGSFERRLLWAAVASCFAGAAFANPHGASVAAGAASFTQSGNTLTVTNAPGTVINWQAFSIGRDEVTRFVQQGATSAVLNRVTGTESSAILGQLLSNGRVFLINPNGVAIGAGATIDVAGFVASSLNLSNEDFLAGRMRFTDSGTGAKVENHGTIRTAAGGQVYLVAPTVENHGVIHAPNGDIVLAAGKSVELVSSHSPDIRVQLDAPGDRAVNVGELVGRNVGIYGGLIANSGQVSATGATVDEAGNIVLKATRDVALDAGSRLAANGAQGGTVTVQAETGTLAANGIIEAKGSSAKGGEIRLLGDRVGVLDRAVVDASGKAGGGAVLVGGDYQGKTPEVQNARRTYVDARATIRADAAEAGDGGKVVVWADEATQFYGTVGARGGAAGGNGGFVEVSGKGTLDFQGGVDTRAARGVTGTLLLDPTDITISGAASTPTAAFGGGAFSDVTTTPSNLNVATLTAQLGASNVVVSTVSPLAGAGDITVNNPINYSSANSLTLNANRNITIVAGSGGINNAGSGAVTLAGGGAGNIGVNESITTNGGAIALTSGTGGVTLAAAKAIDAGSGTITINAGGGAANFSSGTLRTANATASAIGVTNAGALTLGNVALTGGGTLSVSHSGAGTQTAGTAISGTGALVKAGAGTLTLSQANTYTGATTVNAGTLSVSGGNAIVDSGAVVLANAAGATLNVAAGETIGSLSGGGAAGGNVALNANTLTSGDATNTTYSGVISGTGGIVKQGTGTLTLDGANTYTGATGVSGGTLALSGANGAAAASVSFTVNQGARLLLDNAAANNNNRIAGTVAMNGGELAVNGNAAANTVEAIGALTLASGYSTITLTPDVARNTQVTFASFARSAGATALFRGTNLGANTVASQTAGSANIVFTAAPALSGAGNAGTPTVGILAGAIGAGGSSGASSAGSDFVTYNPPTGSVNGLRPLAATEYAAAPAANVNLRLTANRTADDTFTVNSLLLSGGVTYNYNATAGANTVTIASGNVLSVGGANALQPTQNTGGIAFGATEARIFAVSDLSLGANAPVTGTAGLSKSGAGVLLENRGIALTGGLWANAGTLRSGAANAFASQAVAVRAAGAFDLNGFNNTITTLTLESGATSGAAVTTGVGTLTLANNVTLNVNGTGATGASIGGNLSLGAATRTFTVNNGVAANDLAVSAVVSGAGGLTKAGAGTLALAGANTYTGVTTISAGTLAASTLADGGVASSIGASANAATNLVLANGTLQYTGGTASTNRNYTINAGTTGTIGVANAATNLTMSGASANTTGALTKTGAGTLTLSGANQHTGATTVAGGTLAEGASNALASGALTVTGGATFSLGAFSDTVGAVTLVDGSITGTGTLTGTSYVVQNGTVGAVLAGAGALTKTTAGTVTLSNANTYTGATTVNAGMLSVSSLANGGAASGIGASGNAAGNLVLGGGTLRYTGGSVATDRNYTLTAATTSSIDVANAATNLTVNGASTNTTGALTKLGDGTLTLTGANLNSGTTTIRAGTLQVGNGGATGTLGTGGVTNLGTLVFNRSNALTVANVVSSFGAVTQQGSGTTTLTGANTYTGATTVNAGTLQLGAANRIADASAVTVAAGATFNLAGFAETVGSIAGTGTITLGAGTLTAGGNNTSTTFSGAITGTGGFTKAGTGTLTLSGTNTYTGATTINAGTLTASGGSAISDTSQVTLANAAGATLNLASSETIGNLSGGGGAGGNVTLNGNTLTVNETGTTTYAGAISGAGGLTKTGAGTLTLSGANTYAGATAINAGTLTASGGNAIPDASAVTLANAAGATLNLASSETIGNLSGGGGAGGNVTLNANTLTVNETGATAYAGAISGTGGLAKSGTGTLTLSGNSSYSGLTTIGAGTLVAASNNALGNATGATTIASGATLALSGGITSAEAVTVNGSGDAGNGRAGAIDSIGGTNALSGAITLGSASTIAASAGTLNLSGGIAGGGSALAFGGAGAITESGAIAGAGTSVTKNGGGALVLSGTNTYGGATTINAGTLTASGGNAIPDASAVTLANAAGATLNLASSETIGNLSGGGGAGGDVTLGANTLTVSETGATTYAGAIGGTGGLVKTGAGTLTLSGANTYGGATLVGGGTLVAASASALGSTASGTTVSTGATLGIDNVALGAEPVTLNGTGVGGNGALVGTGAASLAGNVALASNSSIAASAGATLTLSGTIDGAFGLTTAGNGVLNLNGTVGGATPLASLATAATGTTGIGAPLVRTTGSQTYNNPTSVGAGATLQSTAGNVTMASALTGAGALALDAAGNVTLGNASFGTMTAKAGGAVNVNGVLTATGGGDSIVLAGATFVNGAGAGALVVPGSGRWLVYSANPAGNSFNGLLSGNQAIWNRSYPSGVSESGNRYVFSTQPTITLTSTNASKTYGDDATAAVAAAYTPAGLVNAAAYGNVFTQDTLANATSGTALVTSPGSPATASVSGSPYAIIVDASGVTATTGYAIASASPGQLTVNPAALTYVADPASRVYGEPNPAFTGTVTGFKNGETIASATTGTLAFGSTALATSNVGSYAIDGSGLAANNGNYTFAQAPANTTALTIAQRPVTLTAGSASREYGDANPAVGVTASPTGVGTGIASFDTLAGAFPALGASSGATATTNVGTYASGANAYSVTGAVNANYAVTTVQGTLDVTPATLAYVANPASRVYGEPNPAFTGTVTGFKNGETIASATTGALAFGSPALPTSNVGSYAIDGSGLTANNGNYVFAQAPGNASALTIGQRPITLTAGSASREYGDPNPAVGVTANPTGPGTGLASFDTLSGAFPALGASSGAVATTNVGTYASGANAYSVTGAANGNYAVTTVQGTLTITSATLNYVADPAARPYGEPNPAFTGTVTGFKNGETIGSATTGTLAFSTTAAQGSAVGSYAVDGSGLVANNGNYVFTQAPGNAAALGVNPRPITIAANAGQGKVYGDADPVLTYAVANGPGTTGAALYGADTLVGALARAAGENVGAYAINQGTLAPSPVAPNYTVTFVPQNFAIAPAPLSVAANPQTKVYGTADPALTYVATGFKFADTPATVLSGALARLPGETVVGSPYAILQGSLVANANYTLAYTGAAFTITPAALTIAANGTSRLYGDPNPPFSATFTGLANGDTPAAIPGVTLATPATIAANVGAYPITVSSGANPNYTIAYVPGTLTIVRAPLTIAADDAAKRVNTPNPPFTATATGFKLGQGVGELSGALAFFTPATLTSPAGMYPIVPSGVSSPNYDVTFVNGTLVVSSGLPPENQAYIVGLQEAARFPAAEEGRDRRQDRRGIECIELERANGERRLLYTCY